MAIYDVYPNPHGGGYLLDVQSNVLSELGTRIVIPLMPVNETPTAFKRLNPQFQIDRTAFLLATHIMSAIPAGALSQPVANLTAHATEITDAVDFLLHGY